MTETTTTTTDETTAIGSTLVGAIEDAWEAIARRHPDLPARIVAITGSGARGLGSLVRGHWSAARWETEGENLPEVFISGERMSDGARGVLTTLIHEATHGLAHARGIKDTSRQGRWHNKRFKALAEEMGLTVTDTPDPSIGFSMTYWNDHLEEEYAEEVAALEAAITATIPNLFTRAMEGAALIVAMLTAWGWGTPSTTMVAAQAGPVRKPRKPRRRKVTLACQCSDLEVFEDQAAGLDLTCNSCGTDMEVWQKG